MSHGIRVLGQRAGKLTVGRYWGPESLEKNKYATCDEGRFVALCGFL